VLNEIVKACQKLYERGFVANHDGNITARLDDGTFLATPTSYSKGDVTDADIIKVDNSGKVISGPHKVFSEITWHLAIYRARPDVKCIVHAHPPIASGMALAGREIGVPSLPEAIVSLGRNVLNSKFISPTDGDLAAAVEAEAKRCLAESDAFIAPGNGAWTVGTDVMQTYYRMELVEHIAHQHFVAAQLGEVRKLPVALVEDLMKRRPKPAAIQAANAASAKIQHDSLLDKDQLRNIVLQELTKLLK
jgi:L-fuculose-phosphate aldolase